MWTQFWDMHSGGGLKESFSQCFIEAPEAEAIVIFYNRFGHNPERVSCSCCGEDYSINEHETLQMATAYERGCSSMKINDEWTHVEGPGKDSWRDYVTLEEYVKRDGVRVIYMSEITGSDRSGDVPEQGFVWK